MGQQNTRAPLQLFPRRPRSSLSGGIELQSNSEQLWRYQGSAQVQVQLPWVHSVSYLGHLGLVQLLQSH